MPPAGSTSSYPRPTPPRLSSDSGALRREWIAARDEAVSGYRRWCAAPRDFRLGAYAVYVAALDREDAAASAYGAAARREE